MNKLKWLAAVLTGWYVSYKLYDRYTNRMTVQNLDEMEDFDAYNADDQQAPFEEVTPRPRHL